jgi:hypothetical protein
MITTKTAQNKDYRPLVIDLETEQGNAFYIIGTAWQLGKQIGLEKKEIQVIVDKMTASNYENLISVFDANFGDYVKLIINI